MWMNIKHSCCVLPFAIVAGFSTDVAIAGQWSVETGAVYTSGKYGGAQTTDMTYVPVSCKYQSDAWALKLSVPYLQITGPASAINLLNGVNLTGTAVDAVPVTRSGLGDVMVSGTRNVYNGGEAGTVWNISGKIKFGTASVAKGLGTGKHDYAIQAEVFKLVGRTTAFGSMGYKMYGSPPGYSLRNVLYGAVGVSRELDSEMQGGLLVSMSQKATVTGSGRLETLFFLNRKLGRDWKAQAYVLRGFSHSTPDWGVGVTLAHAL